MSKPHKHEFDLVQQVQQHRRSDKRWPKGHSLCNQPPIAPTGVSITWDRNEQMRHGVTRGTVTWDEVTLDVDGFDSVMAHYAIQWQKSDDGAAADAHTHHFMVVAKSNDDDTTGEKVVKGVHKKYYYRARVRAIDTNQKRGAWSSWTSWQHPNPSNNAAVPTNVVNIETDHRVGITWDPAGTFDSSTNLPDLSVSHYQVQVAKATAFTTLKADEKHIVANHYRYAVPSVDHGDAHYLRVRSVSHDGDVSAWQPADTGIEATDTSGATGVLPAGSIHHFAHAPSGSPLGWNGGAYLECNGQSVLRATFADLFTAIGTTYGSADGTHFNVPDIKNRKIISKGTNFALAADDGITENSRDQAHEAHGAHDAHDTLGDHQHDNHGAHDSHTGHDGHSDHSTSSGHTHSAGGLDTGTPSATTNVNSSGAQAVGGPNHTHNVSGFTSGSGGSHSDHGTHSTHGGHTTHGAHPAHTGGGSHAHATHGGHTAHTKHHYIVLHTGIKS